MLNPDAPKPLANALYINLPMRWLSQNPEFRGFIHDCSADIGNEEIALHIWALRHFFKTGEKLPKDSLSRHVTAAHDFNNIWRQYREEQTRLFPTRFKHYRHATIHQSFSNFNRRYIWRNQSIVRTNFLTRLRIQCKIHFKKPSKIRTMRSLSKNHDDVQRLHQKFVTTTKTTVKPVVNLNERLEQFQAFLSDKTVALAGRANYLAQLELGRKINSYDVVIRIHTYQIHGEPQKVEYSPGHESKRLTHHSYVPAVYQPNIGSKTDVLYLRLQWIPYDVISRTLDTLTHDSVEWVGVETFFEMAQAAPQHHYIEQHWGPVHMFPVDFYGSVSARLNYAEPLPGTLVAAFLAESQAREVFIVGCPCYQDNFGKNEHAKLQIMGKHNTLADFHYLRQLIQRDERFTCDAIMNSLFNTEIS